MENTNKEPTSWKERSLGDKIAGVVGGLMLGGIGLCAIASFGLAGAIAYQIATTDFYDGDYQNVRVQKRVSRKSTEFILQDKEYHTADDPRISGFLQNGKITNVREHLNWFGYKGVSNLHRFTDYINLEKALSCATNKQSNLTKWTGLKF